MNYPPSLKHLFNRKNIQSKKNNTNPNHNKSNSSSLYPKQSTISGNELNDNLKLLNFSKISTVNSVNKKQSKILKDNSSKINISKSKENKSNILKSIYDCDYATSTTQTPIIKNKNKKFRNFSTNSRNKQLFINIKKNNLKKKFNTEKYFLCRNNKNNICINSTIKKTIFDAIVDNNSDLLKEYKNQTINNFNNKYKLKFKKNIPKVQDKVINVFSLLKKYKFEEDKKFKAIMTISNKIPKKIKNRNKLVEIFNINKFEKNFTLVTKDFDIKNKLKDDKKFVSIHTLNLMKNKY